MHILITLNKYQKLATAKIVDKYISAEIPTPEENRELHDAVMKHMIHGPCGSRCWDDKKNCSKHFPKPYQNETTFDENSLPQYQRRNSGIKYKKGDNFYVDNKDVVPYNPTLLLLFKTHINVEAVASIKSIKYLYKYIFIKYINIFSRDMIRQTSL